MLVSSVEEGSLSAAARKLRIPVATLTRNVNDLEALVGTKLLVRSTRKLELTDAGADYVASAKQILEQVDEQERRAAGEFTAPRGELVITTPVQIARLRVLPVIDQFLALYPEIRIRLIQSDRNVDLIDSHADVAIRVGRLRDSSLVATRVGSLRVVVVASKELLRKHGEPRRRMTFAVIPGSCSIVPASHHGVFVTRTRDKFLRWQRCPGCSCHRPTLRSMPPLMVLGQRLSSSTTSTQPSRQES